jgi:Skp family chaperone for outer membrane proteins
MNIVRFPVLLAAALAVGLSLTTPGLAAAQLAPPVIAVVDVQKILQESSAAKGIQKAIESQRDVYQKEISALEEKLRSAEQELRKQQTVLAPDAFAQKRRDFEKQVTDVQRTVATRKRSLDTALGESMGTVQKSMAEIIAEVAREKSANMVLPRNLVVIFDAQFDVTDTVMERLNRKLPAVAVTIPKG